jgi:hypothetical protein
MLGFLNPQKYRHQTVTRINSNIQDIMRYEGWNCGSILGYEEDLKRRLRNAGEERSNKERFSKVGGIGSNGTHGVVEPPYSILRHGEEE